MAPERSFTRRARVARSLWIVHRTGPLRWILPAVVAALTACAQTQAPLPAVASGDAAATPATSTAATSAPAAWDPGEALSPEARSELADVLRDEFCPCGCPHTIAACIAKHQCQHARRAASLAARMVGAGVPASETVLALAQYYRGFRSPRAALTPDPRQCQGPADAKVTLVTFSDFECPYCAAASPVIEAFAKANAESLRYCSLIFPLPLHPNALTAGQAALFAREHGRFWELHTRMFQSQADLSPTAVRALARELGLDAAALDRAIASEQYLAELEAQADAGRAAGVKGTPTIFFNGRRFNLPLSDENLSLALEEELEWVQHGGAWAKD